MKRMIFLGLVFSTLISSNIFAMSLQNFIERSLKEDKEVQEIFLQYDIDKSGLEAVLERWDLSLFVAATERQTEGEGSTAKTTQLTATAPATASSVELSYQNNAITSLFTDVTALEFNQRLWNNGFGSVYRLQDEQVKQRTKLAVLSLNEEIEAYLGRLIFDYIDVYYLSESIKHYEKVLFDAKRLGSNLSKRFRSGIALESDFLQSEVSVLRAEMNLKDVRAEYKNLIDKINRRLAGNGFKSPRRPAFVARLDPGVDLKELRPVKIANEQLLIASSEVSIRKSSLDPRADAVLGVENRKLRGSSNLQEYYYLGLQLELPVRNQKKRYQLAEQEKIRERNKLRVAMAQDELLSKKALLKNQIMTTKESLDLQKKMQSKLQRIQSQEIDRFNKGLLDLREVLASQQSLDDLKLSLLREDVALQKLIVEWDELHDQLLPKYLSKKQ